MLCKILLLKHLNEAVISYSKSIIINAPTKRIKWSWHSYFTNKGTETQKFGTCQYTIST